MVNLRRRGRGARNIFWTLHDTDASTFILATFHVWNGIGPAGGDDEWKPNGRTDTWEM